MITICPPTKDLIFNLDYWSFRTLFHYDVLSVIGITQSIFERFLIKWRKTKTKVIPQMEQSNH